MHSKVKNYALVFCLFVFLFVIIGGGLHHEPGRRIPCRSDWNSTGDLCLSIAGPMGIAGQSMFQPDSAGNEVRYGSDKIR